MQSFTIKSFLNYSDAYLAGLKLGNEGIDFEVLENHVLHQTMAKSLTNNGNHLKVKSTDVVKACNILDIPLSSLPFLVCPNCSSVKITMVTSTVENPTSQWQKIREMFSSIWKSKTYEYCCSTCKTKFKSTFY